MKPKLTPDAKALFDAILSLDNLDECAKFFRIYVSEKY